MKRLSIYKNAVLTNQLDFETQEALEAGLAYHHGMWSFGQKREVIQHPAYSTETQVEIFPAIVDANGVEISPAQFETQVTETPAWEQIIEGYEVEITDITAQLEQEAINAEAEAYLKATDKWATREAETGTPQPEGIKAARAAARARIVN